MKLKIFLSAFFCVVFANSGVGAEERWKEYRTSHFIVFYQDAPRDFVESVEDFAERYYDEITQNLGFTRYRGWTFDDRAKIYIYNSKDHYVASARAYGWSHGIANARDKVIRTFPAAHGFFDSTLPHELGHIIFREFVGLNAVLPMWMDEGVAMFQEKAKRWGAHADVRKTIEDGSFIPLPDLTRLRLSSSTDVKVVNLYYAEAASIMNFLITEQGEARFVIFCKKIRRGESFMDAFKHTYARFQSLEDLNKSWVHYLKKQ